MVEAKNTRDQLEGFAKSVISSARLELKAKHPKKVYRAKWKNGKLESYQIRIKRYKSENTGELGKSLDYEIKEVLGNLIVVFSAEDYWYYINFGRQGELTKGEEVKGPKPEILDQWIRTKPIKMQDFGTDANGNLYTKGFKKKTAEGLRAMSFMINRKIKMFGTEGNKFWTKSMELHSDELRENLGKKIAKDLAGSIQKQISA